MKSNIIQSLCSILDTVKKGASDLPLNYSSGSDNLNLNQNKGYISFLKDIQIPQAAKQNLFLASFIKGIKVFESFVLSNNLRFSRLANVLVQKSKIENVHFLFSYLDDIKLSESYMMNQTLDKSFFKGLSLKNSRLERLSFFTSRVTASQWDNCEMYGIYFDNCVIDKCNFSHLRLLCPEGITLSHKKIIGKNFSNIQTIEEFLRAIDKEGSTENPATSTEAAPQRKESAFQDFKKDGYSSESPRRDYQEAGNYRPRNQNRYSSHRNDGAPRNDNYNRGDNYRNDRNDNRNDRNDNYNRGNYRNDNQRAPYRPERPDNKSAFRPAPSYPSTQQERNLDFDREVDSISKPITAPKPVVATPKPMIAESKPVEKVVTAKPNIAPKPTAPKVKVDTVSSTEVTPPRRGRGRPPRSASTVTSAPVKTSSIFTKKTPNRTRKPQ